MPENGRDLFDQIRPILVDDEEAEYEILNNSFSELGVQDDLLHFSQTVADAESYIGPHDSEMLPFVFLDLDLGKNEVNGLEALKALRSISPISVIVAYTRSDPQNVEIGGQQLNQEDLLRLGFDAFLDKQDLQNLNFRNFLLDQISRKFVANLEAIRTASRYRMAVVDLTTFSASSLRSLDTNRLASEIAAALSSVRFNNAGRDILVVFDKDLSFLSYRSLRIALAPLLDYRERANLNSDCFLFSGSPEIVKRCEEIMGEAAAEVTLTLATIES